MIPEEAVEAAAKEVYHTSGRSRSMPYTVAIRACESEALKILTAAATFLRAQALEEVADLIEPFSGIGMANGATRGDVARWLRARAVTERGGE